MKKLVSTLALFAFCLAFSYGCWRFERWLNWRFDYGKRVETRIEELERRVSELEKR